MFSKKRKIVRKILYYNINYYKHLICYTNYGTTENLDIAGIAVDYFFKLNYEDTIIFIEKYEVRVFKLNTFGYSISILFFILSVFRKYYVSIKFV